MPNNPRKRQKKQERKSAKRKEKKHQLARREGAGLPERLTAATRHPVLHCWVTDSLQQEGLGWVILSRELPNAHVAVANFLVDRYCLGVKNAFADILTRSVYDSRYARRLLVA